MTAVLQPVRTTGKAPALHVERTGIVFANRAPGIVHIEIEVENRGTQPTRPADAVLTAAPFGAFVDWRPLTLLRVPALRAGRTCLLTTAAARPAVAPLGPPEHVSPGQLLTALGAEDQPPGVHKKLVDTPRTGKLLPADLFELCGHTNPHWAGNLNVFIGAAPVERHVAQALRVYPGQLNTAFFIVGSGPDDYAFELSGAGADWQAALYSMNGRHTLRVDANQQRPVGHDWLHIAREDCLALALVPPANCTTGAVNVEVTKRSTGEVAVVEFSLDARASGPGCFVVS